MGKRGLMSVSRRVTRGGRTGALLFPPIICLMSGTGVPLTPESRQRTATNGHVRLMAVPVTAQRTFFESMYHEHRPRVLAYCLRRSRPEDADDACAETFLVAWRHIEKIPPSPETLPYLYGIAAKVLSNQLRSLNRRTRLESRLANLGIAPATDPSTLVVQNARDQEVVAAVRKLKHQDREIVMLYAWEDLPREVIAHMLGMTRAAIDQRIHRSYKRLARMLAPVPDPAINPPPIAKEGGV